MPTPSANQSHRLTSPPSYAFQTCPDDQPHAAWQSQALAGQGDNDMEIHQVSSTVDASPSSYSSNPTHDRPAAHETATFDGRLHIETPRSRTVSPRPSASRNMPPSPMSNEQSNEELLKNQANDRGIHSSPGSSTSTGSVQELSSSTISVAESMTATTVELDGYRRLPSTENDDSRLRTIPIAPSSYLRAGSKFHGTQRSERQVYEVQVEIKHVDMRESFLCGYLRIQGLTEDHPTLTTYFEGEIIGSKYNFYTQHEDWGANVKVDLSHWSKFRPFRPFFKMARKGPISIPENDQKDYIFMRWKEHFLVPDHRVRTITGASFEGFYYICFNQLKGEVSGIYFHSKSEKFQQLELKHVPDRGCFSALEFR